MDTADNTISSDPEKIIQDYHKLAYSIAWSYRNHGVPLEDLQQESLMGLLAAHERFDPSMNTKFSTYAVYWIKKYVLSAISKEHSTSLQAVELVEEHLSKAEFHLSSTDRIDSESEEELSLPSDMPPKEQQVIQLSYQKRMTLKEIAEIMNISPEAVKQLRQKALRRLKHILPNSH